MQLLSRETRLTPFPPLVADLAGLQRLIYLGRLDTTDKLHLALRSICKSERLGQGELTLLVADSLRFEFPARAPESRLFQLPLAKLEVLLAEFGAAGRLLFPCHNEHFGNVALYALASGIPLDAINYRTGAAADLGSLPRTGDAFIGVGRNRRTPAELKELHSPRSGAGRANPERNPCQRRDPGSAAS